MTSNDRWRASDYFMMLMWGAFAYCGVLASWLMILAFVEVRWLFGFIALSIGLLIGVMLIFDGIELVVHRIIGAERPKLGPIASRSEKKATRLGLWIGAAIGMVAVVIYEVRGTI